MLPGPEALAAVQSLSLSWTSNLVRWIKIREWQMEGKDRLARSRSLEDPGIPIGQGYEAFDAELLGVVRALQVAEKVGDQRPVTILLESQAAIARLRHTQPGPGQAIVIQAHAIAKKLLA